MGKKEQSIKDMWDNFKQLHIYEAPKEEGRREKKYFKK